MRPRDPLPRSAPAPGPARHVGRVVEVGDLAAFDVLVAGGVRRLRGWRITDVDLTERAEVLARLDVAGALFAGCRMGTALAADLHDRGALVFPEIPGLPFEPYRSRLYSPDELYAGWARDYEATLDARVYAWSTRGHDADDTMAIALHDSAIDGALDRLLADRAVVGVMGGHALERGTDGYAEAAALGRGLRRAGWTVATGGGPGAMEAANLGSYCAGGDDDRLDWALARLAEVPSFRPSVTDWVGRAFAVRAELDGDGGVGIPTWFYGHEPPNAFAAEIAKYFQNATREDTLLRRCDGGIVFLPGAGGTVQEIFQDACENYYAEPATVAPMVLVGVRHWTETVPAWPLLSALAAGRPMERAIALVDSVAAAVERLGAPLASER